MVKKLNAAKLVRWRNINDLQFGDSTNAVILENATEAQRKMIGILQKGVADEQLPYFAEQLNLSAAESTSLLEKLKPVLTQQTGDKANLRFESPQAKTHELDAVFVQNSFAELVRAEANLNVSGSAVVAMRAHRTVYLDSLGKTGLALTRALAASGIGRIVSHDSRPILPADIGADGFEQSHQGQSRFSISSKILSRNHLHARVSNANRMSAATLSKIDCAILISQSVTAPARYAIWARKNIPHLNIVFGEQFIDVSPVIIPGENPCLRCLDLHRTSVDSAWPAMASQILASNLRFDDASSRLFAVGLAAKAALLHLDRSIFGFETGLETINNPDSSSTKSAASQRGFRLDLAAHKVHEFSWPTSPSCDCRRLTN